MGNQLSSSQTNHQTGINQIPNTPKSLEEVFFKAWLPLSQAFAEEGLTLNPNVKQRIMQYLDQDVINFGLGAMFGAFMGDALGSYLQFQTKISSNYANQAMQMPGGGRAFPFLLPGQFTDDSELASHLLRGLLNYNTEKSLKQQEKSLLAQIASQYNSWYNSRPFDIGHTTRAAMMVIAKPFNAMKEAKIQDQKQFFIDNEMETIFKSIAEKNASSQSNGSLMRITPMAFFVALMMENSTNPEEKKFDHYHNLVRCEINMTHGCETIFQTSEAYVNLLVNLIRRSGTSLDQILQQFQDKYTSNGNENLSNSIKNVSEWIKDSKFKPPSAITSMGWAKIAFTQTLITLRKLIGMESKKENFKNPQVYKELIRQVLIQGGDTDTNGAIVGGLIGAVVGFKNLPMEYLDKQLRLKMGNIKKSQWLAKRTQYEPKRTFLNAFKMIEKFYPEEGMKQEKMEVKSREDSQGQV